MNPARAWTPGAHLGLCVSDLERSRAFYEDLAAGEIDEPGGLVRGGQTALGGSRAW